MKLTNAQVSILSRELHISANGSNEKFLLLYNHHDDKVAKNLSNKGLGYFANFAWQYSWRKRNGYYNHFVLNDLGIRERDLIHDKS